MHEALAYDFPFVNELPKREKSRFKRLWDQLTAVKAAVEEHGAMLPVQFAANLAGVSRQRIDELVGSGLLLRIEVDGHPFITENSLVAWAQTERKAGRPLKVPQGDKAVWKAARSSVKNSSK